MLTYFAHSWKNIKTGKYGIPVTYKEKYAKKNMFFLAYFCTKLDYLEIRKKRIPLLRKYGPIQGTL